MASRRAEKRSSARSRSGFTLAELVVSMVLGGLVIGLTFQLMQAHGRYARMQSERTAVQQNGRGVADILAAELRGADPLAIQEAGASSIRFHVPRAWGVVCRHTAAELIALFPTPAVAALEPRDEWIAIAPVASSVVWQFLPAADRTYLAADRAIAEEACVVLGSSVVPAAGEPGQARRYIARVIGDQGGSLGIIEDEVGLDPGRTVYVYDPVRYDVASTSTAPGLWIRRNSGPAMSMQPLSGPIASADGLLFSYFDEDGAEIPTPIGEADLARIRRVEVRVVASSRTEFAGRPLLDSTHAVIVLRNSR